MLNVLHDTERDGEFGKKEGSSRISNGEERRASARSCADTGATKGHC